jgi:hypothetical protein
VRCDRAGQGMRVWVAGLLGGKGIPCRQRGAAAGVTEWWWTGLAEAAATCKRNEDEAASSGDATSRAAGLRAMLESPTVEGAAEGPINGSAAQVVKRAVVGVVGGQGSRVHSPSSATLQAPGLPYTSGPYLGHASAT